MTCDFPYTILRTGSQGNAVVLSESVLVDCGVPFKVLKPVYRALKLVLLTHIHTDHFHPVTLRTLARERPTLRFGCGPWLAAALAECGVNKANIDVLKDGLVYDYGFVTAIPVPLTHNVANQGYKLHFPQGKVFYATDTGNLNGITAKDYDLYLVEANHTEAEIQQRIQDKKAIGEFPYELQAAENHLSKEQCDGWLYRNIGSNSTYVYLHCHQDKAAKE